MSDSLNASMGSLFIQFTPGKKPEYVGGCVDVDALTEPKADRTPIICRDVNGNAVSKGSIKGTPGAPTTSLTALEFPEQSALDLVGDCDLNLYLMSDPCAKLGLIQSYARGRILQGAGLTSRAEENIVKREGNDATTLKLDFTGRIPVLRVRPLTLTRQDIAETTDLLAIAFCNTARCAGDCGDAQDLGEDGFIGGAAPAGSAASYADVWDTDNSGALWNHIAGPHPLNAGFDITAVVCFPIDRDTTRWLAFSESQAGVPLHCAYSDDGGTTWTQVHIGSTNSEGVLDAQAVKAFDSAHIWVGTDDGNIYFSEDGGLTWEDQSVLAVTAGADITAIDFSDYANGYAVGVAGLIIRTVNGADWSDAPCNDPSGGDGLRALQVFSGYRLEVGTVTGELYQSWDAGITWEAKIYTTQAATDTITDLEFANDLNGFMLVHPAVGQDYVHKSIDGGHTWERLATPVNLRLNDIYVGDGNLAYVVGNAQGGTGVVLKVS
jgi:photosystem II stability/assembly factor-like uncharacterized protein